MNAIGAQFGIPNRPAPALPGIYTPPVPQYPSAPRPPYTPNPFAPPVPQNAQQAGQVTQNNVPQVPTKLPANNPLPPMPNIGTNKPKAGY